MHKFYKLLIKFIDFCSEYSYIYKGSLTVATADLSPLTNNSAMSNTQ